MHQKWEKANTLRSYLDKIVSCAMFLATSVHLNPLTFGFAY